MSDTSKFLEKVFKIQRMNQWRIEHPEQWAQFSDWAGSGTGDNSKLNTDQHKWLDCLERTGPNPADPFVREPDTPKGFLKIKDFPAFGALSDDKAWEELYAICHNAWYQMKHDTNAYAGYKDSVKQFIANTTRFFEDISDDVREAAPQTRKAIDSLFNLLDHVDPVTLSTLGINNATELQKLKKDNYNIMPPSVPKYNTDAEVRKRIQEIANKVVNPQDATTKDKLDKAAEHTGAVVEPFLTNYIGQQGKDLRIIANDYYGWTERSANGKLAEFKNHYTEFLKPIYSDDDVFKAFDAKEGGNKPITSAINKVKKDINYDDTNSKNYVPPKRQDELTLVEQIQKWAGDTYSDYFKKYKELRGATIFEHPNEVNVILKQIDKAKIKTTDPLTKLAENADTIKKALGITNHKAAEAFEWLGNALKEFNADPNMSKTMAGALKNGRKMRNLVSELIMKAAENGKPETINKAKIALEVLSVIKYGATTSKIMNTLKEDKELFNILSNKDLSWNKNEGVKFITTAIDKTVRAAFLGAGYGATMIVNRLRRTGIRFNGHLTNQKMRQSYKDWQAKNASGKADARAVRDADNAVRPLMGPDPRSELKKEKDKATDDKANSMAGLRGARRFAAGVSDDDVLKQSEMDINTLKANEWKHQSTVDDFEEKIGFVIKAKKKYERLAELDAEEIGVVGAPMTSEQKTARIQEIVHERNEIQKELKNLGYEGKVDLTSIGLAPDYDLSMVPGPNPIAELENIENDLNIAPAYTKASDYLSRTQMAIYERQQKLDTYRKATQNLKEAEEQIKVRNKQFNEWDDKHQNIYLELMSYWDTLQDPKLKSYSPRRASKIQAKNKNLVHDLWVTNRSGYVIS